MEHNTIQEMKQILEAIEQGKKIQYQMVNPDDPDKWCGYVGNTPNFYDFRYRIKPETEETLLTNRELAKWLAQGNGEWIAKVGDKVNRVSIKWWYTNGYEDEAVANVLIRKWSDTEWHKPTREYTFGEVKNEA